MARRAQTSGRRRREASRRGGGRERPRARRRFPRWRVRGIKVIGPIAASRVVDLGPAGAGIECPRGLRVGQPYAFTLQLKESNHRIRGRVRWCRLVACEATGERRLIYRAGISWSPQPIAERVARAEAGAERP